MTVTVCDVGPRDGLQNEPEILEPATRAALARRLAAAGLPAVEAVSFVRDDLVPQMAGAEEVVADLDADRPTRWSGLVLNERGLQRAMAAGLDEVHVAVMATEAFAQRNTRMSLPQAIEVTRRTVAAARAVDLHVVGTVSVAFGCPFEGHVDPDRVIDAATALVDAGAQELVLADTIGVATPRPVRELVRRALELGVPVGAHLHDTRNTAMANTMAALEAGATTFETSVGGIGGCPFAPGATGNLATEDLVYLLDGEGVQTGIDLGELIAVSHWLEGELGRAVPAALARAPAPVA
jgi:(R)-citramalyl-CoA lyase